MATARFKNVEWRFTLRDDGRIETWEQAQIAILMDLRDELQRLNAVFAYQKVQQGFAALRQLARLNEAAFKRRVDAAVRKRLLRKEKK